MLSKDDKILISKLKGRLVKQLNMKTRLLKLEKTALEDIYNTIDKFIINDDEFKDIEVFRDTLFNNIALMENSKKEYIRDHIIPLVTKAATRHWGIIE